MKFVLVILLVIFCWVTNTYSQYKWKKDVEEFIIADVSFEQCHAPTLVELGNGKMLAAWFAGSKEGANDVSVWLSAWDNSKWSKPKIIASGNINDSVRFPCWNPVLFKTKGGKLFLFYKVGPSPQKWWGMVMRSGDDGKSWSRSQNLPEGILGPVKNKPLQLDDGSILSGSSTETQNSWKVHVERSADNGRTWTKIQVDTLSSIDVIQPALIKYATGRIQMLCRSKQGVVVQAWSTDNGKTWSKLSKTGLMNPNSGIDAVTLNNGQQLIVYNPDMPGKEWFNGRARLYVAISKDGYKWTDIAVLENGINEEFSYPAVIQTTDAKVHIIYTYKRKNIKHVVLQHPGLFK